MFGLADDHETSGIVSVGVPITVVVDTIVTNLLRRTVVNHAVAVVVDTVAADFVIDTGDTVGVVRRAIAVVGEPITTAVDAAALSIFPRVRPERAMVAGLDALE